MDVTPEPVLADYAGACVSNLVPALFGLTGGSWLPAPVVDARVVVLLVIDGLGANAIEQFADCVPTLASMAPPETGDASITTVLPATTSAALTSITTGTAPGRHGIVGYRTLVDERVLNVLRWQYEGEKSRGPVPHEVQRQPAFRGRPIPVTTKSDFKTTGFTLAHLGGLPFHGWKTPSVLIEHCRNLALQPDASLIYAYYPGVDEVAHEFGLLDGYYKAELRHADAIVARLLSVLPSDVALLVTADHGQTHIEPDDWIDTLGLAPMLRAQSGDARFRHLHARAGAAKDLLAECEARFGDIAWVRSRKALLADGWLGPSGPGLSPAGSRIGDVILMPFEPVGFIDPALPKERGLRSAHGAPTPAEMRVPLRAARGQAVNRV